MKHLLLKLSSVLLVSAVIFTSCAKDGEMGPPGEQGEQGPQGPAGPAGPKGDTGVANVIYSAWTPVTLEGTFGEWPVPKLTAGILNEGVVMVYWKIGELNDGSGPVIGALPAEFPSWVVFGEDAQEDDENFGLTPLYFPGMIEIHIMNGYAATEPITFDFRYVLIPGGVEGRKMNGKSVNFDNYEEVKSYLGLKD